MLFWRITAALAFLILEVALNAYPSLVDATSINVIRTGFPLWYYHDRFSNKLTSNLVPDASWASGQDAPPQDAAAALSSCNPGSIEAQFD